MTALAHISCCHDRTLTLCGLTISDDGDDPEPDCVVCLALHPDLSQCPLGGACHLAEQPTPKEKR